MEKEEQMKIKKLNNLKKLKAIFLLFLLNACSHTNVQGEWDCGKQQGYGCINIERADINATAKIETNNPILGVSLNNDDEAEFSKKEYDIWFAEYVDSDQNFHEISKVRYKQ
jgi:hypothetical protein